MSERTCPSCSQTKDERDFWSGARRCRSCVAVATGAIRSERAQEERERIQEEFGLKISISGRRFKALQTGARQMAEGLVPKSRRDTFADASSRASVVCGVGFFGMFLFGSSLFGDDTSAIIVIAGGLLAGWIGFHRLATFLSRPRNGSVADISDQILKGQVARVEAEQLDYLRFYATPEWRAARDTVIRRDGRVCKQCSQHIALTRDVTVDHIRPRSKFPGLALDLTNLQVLCRRCNSSKGATV